MRPSDEHTIRRSFTAPSLERDQVQWEQLLSATHLPWTATLDTSPHATPFTARVRRQWIDDLALVDCECGPCAGTRTSTHIAATDNEFLIVLINRRGRESVSQDGATIELTPGCAVSWDSTRPAHFIVHEQLTKRSLIVPRSALEEIGGNAYAHAGIVLHADNPSTQLLTGYLDTLSRNLLNLNATVIAAARNATLELLIGAMRPESTTPSATAIGPALRDAMDRFIAKHLLDDHLTPANLAKAHDVSVRTVNRIYSASGETVTDTIRTRRLARARQELTESTASIATLAHRWGFSDSSHFSRTFKAHYGISPTAFRAHDLTQRGASVHTVGANMHEMPATPEQTHMTVTRG